MRASRELFKGTWLSVHEAGGYEFVVEHRTHAKVAVLGFQGDDAFLLRYESCADTSAGQVPCSLTGSVDAACESVTRAALRELFEESGYKVEVEELIPLGAARPYKASAALYHLFAVDLSGARQMEPTDPVDAGFCEWVDLNDLISASDPLLHMMYLRLQQRRAALKPVENALDGCGLVRKNPDNPGISQYDLRKRAYQAVVDFLDGRTPVSREEYEQTVERLLRDKTSPADVFEGSDLPDMLARRSVHVKDAFRKECYYDVCQRLGREPADEQEYTRTLDEMSRELDSPGE